MIAEFMINPTPNQIGKETKMKLTDKDQEAIKHIAKVSTNPNADLIVMQLITGWDLKNKHTGVVIKNNQWISDDFVLIKPKPAYRVYRKIGCKGTYTLDKYADERFNAQLPANCEFISDWIEYEETKEWPTILIERIAAIDIDAAQWIINNQNILFDGGGSIEIESKLLCSMFNWDKTPQGYDYWSKISKELGE